MIEPAPFECTDADLPTLQAALTSLTRAGYSEAGVCQRLALSDITALQWRALPIYRAEHLARREALDIAIDLWLLQGEISADELARLHDPAARDVLTRAGLLATNARGLFCARASIFPVGDGLICSDHAWPQLPHPGLPVVSENQVMFIGTDSHWLVRTTVRRSITAALDICTGSGIHALLAARHAKHVTAVDINPRAERCTRFNARLRNLAHLEVKLGDVYAPVAGQRFDLITANPPFVPSPVNTLKYRDGGPSGEDVQRRIVAGLPQFLNPTGIAQIVTELGERDGEALGDRLRSWLNGAAMDIHILRLREIPAAAYATGHAAGEDESYGAYLRSVHDWYANLKAQGYVRVIPVLLAFKWSDPACGPWTRMESALPPTRDCGPEIDATFHAERLSRQPHLLETLKKSRVQRAEPLRLAETFRLPGAETAVTVELPSRGLVVSEMLPSTGSALRILLALQKALSFAELCALSSQGNLDEAGVVDALRDLLRRRLVFLLPLEA